MVVLPLLGLLGLAVATGVALVALGVVEPLARPAAGQAPSPAAAPSTASLEPVDVESSRTTQAREILADWDRDRARAWSTGDVGALRSLYVQGSQAAERDAGMLRRWADRGLRVRHLQMRVTHLEVLTSGPTTWRLRVSDRVAGAYAVPAGAASGRVPLPRDRTTTRVLGLRRVDDRWVVATVSRST